MFRVTNVGIGALVLVWTVAAVNVGAQNPGGAAAKALKNPVPANAASVRTGEQLYQKNCQFCHGPKAMGDGRLAPKGSMPANLTDATWDHGSTDGEIFTVIAEGLGAQSVMKGVKGRISDRDIWNIVNYIRSLGPKTAAR